MKNKVYYIIMTIVFILLVVASTITFLVINNTENGTINFIKKYYDIVFTNIMIDDSNILIHIDNDNDSIHVEVPKLNENKGVTTFSVDIKNIGNQDALLSNYSISNIDTNIKKDNVEIFISLNKNEVIKSSYDKKLNVTIKYNGKDKNIVPYYNFNINYLFQEVA